MPPTAETTKHGDTSSPATTTTTAATSSSQRSSARVDNGTRGTGRLYTPPSKVPLHISSDGILSGHAETEAVLDRILADQERGKAAQDALIASNEGSHQAGQGCTDKREGIATRDTQSQHESYDGSNSSSCIWSGDDGAQIPPFLVQHEGSIADSAPARPWFLPSPSLLSAQIRYAAAVIVAIKPTRAAAAAEAALVVVEAADSNAADEPGKQPHHATFLPKHIRKETELDEGDDDVDSKEGEDDGNVEGVAEAVIDRVSGDVASKNEEEEVPSCSSTHDGNNSSSSNNNNDDDDDDDSEALVVNPHPPKRALLTIGKASLGTPPVDSKHARRLIVKAYATLINILIMHNIYDGGITKEEQVTPLMKDIQLEIHTSLDNLEPVLDILLLKEYHSDAEVVLASFQLILGVLRTHTSLLAHFGTLSIGGNGLPMKRPSLSLIFDMTVNKHPEVFEIAHAFFRLATALTFTREENIIAFSRIPGFYKGILNLIRRFQHNPTTNRRGTFLVLNMAINTNCAIALVQHGALDVVYECMTALPDDVAVQEAACCAIWSVCFSSASLTSTSSRPKQGEKLMMAITAAMVRFPNYPFLLENASGALRSVITAFGRNLPSPLLVRVTELWAHGFQVCHDIMCNVELREAVEQREREADAASSILYNMPGGVQAVCRTPKIRPTLLRTPSYGSVCLQMSGALHPLMSISECRNAFFAGHGPTYAVACISALEDHRDAVCVILSLLQVILRRLQRRLHPLTHRALVNKYWKLLSSDDFIATLRHVSQRYWAPHDPNNIAHSFAGLLHDPPPTMARADVQQLRHKLQTLERPFVRRKVAGVAVIPDIMNLL